MNQGFVPGYILLVMEPIGTQRTTGSAHHRRRPNAGMPFVSPQGTIEYA